MYRPGDKVTKIHNALGTREELIVLAKVCKAYIFSEDGMYPNYEYILADSKGQEIPGTYPEEMLSRII